MLFVLGLEPLVTMLTRAADITGIHITTAELVRMVLVFAYADDTTLYLKHMSQLLAVQRELVRFARASGLTINPAKSTVVPLTGGSPQPTAEVGFACLSAAETTRYLGIQVGRGIDGKATWDAAMKALMVRMVLAERKLTTVTQRVLFARAIILPKVLYVARHAFPTADQRKEIAAFIHNYVWTGTSVPRTRARACWRQDSGGWTYSRRRRGRRPRCSSWEHWATPCM